MNKVQLIKKAGRKKPVLVFSAGLPNCWVEVQGKTLIEIRLINDETITLAYANTKYKITRKRVKKWVNRKRKFTKSLTSDLRIFGTL